jgi:hypothetical protein
MKIHTMVPSVAHGSAVTKSRNAACSRKSSGASPMSASATSAPAYTIT